MPKKSPISFAERYNKLEEIMAWFEKGSFDLEEGMKQFSEGSKLVAELKDELKTMENTIHELTKE